MTSYPIHLLDVAAGTMIEAELHDDIAEKQLIDWQFQWRPAAKTYMERLVENGISSNDTAWPQSWHWDWRNKMDEIRDLLGHTGYSVVCRERYPGDDATRSGLETSPPPSTGWQAARLWSTIWKSRRGNWREPYADPPIYRMVGTGADPMRPSRAASMKVSRGALAYIPCRKRYRFTSAAASPISVRIRMNTMANFPTSKPHRRRPRLI